jgi:hypothetical protein
VIISVAIIFVSLWTQYHYTISWDSSVCSISYSFIYAYFIIHCSSHPVRFNILCDTLVWLYVSHAHFSHTNIFCCALFYDAFGISQSVASNSKKTDDWWFGWNVCGLIQIISRDLSGGTYENQKNLSSNLGLRSNQSSSIYNSDNSY